MIQTYHNHSLLSYNTFGIDAKASCFIEYDTPQELRELILNNRIIKPFLHIGQGSNLLFTKDFEGTVLHSRIQTFEVTEETQDTVIVQAGSGVVWDDFVARCVERNLFGIENLSGIPGQTGASAVQNIGAYGVEAKDFIIKVEAINLSGESKTFTVEECKYDYRYSIFKDPKMKNWIITGVTFRLNKKPCYVLDYGTVREEVEKHPPISLQSIRQTIIRIRESKLPDPKISGNAGSFFMNPIISYPLFETIRKEYPQIPHYKVNDQSVKIPAAWLIDQCGWKGKSLGQAAVHDKQPLVLVNKGGAKGNDILKLSDAVRRSVKEKFDIDIHPEVSIIG